MYQNQTGRPRNVTKALALQQCAGCGEMPSVHAASLSSRIQTQSQSNNFINMTHCSDSSHTANTVFEQLYSPSRYNREVITII